MQFKNMLKILGRKKSASIPLLLIKKETDTENQHEYELIESAIAELERDPNVPPDKIRNLRLNFYKLKNKLSITINKK